MCVREGLGLALINSSYFFSRLVTADGNLQSSHLLSQEYEYMRLCWHILIVYNVHEFTSQNCFFGGG